MREGSADKESEMGNPKRVCICTASKLELELSAAELTKLQREDYTLAVVQQLLKDIPEQ